MDKLENAGISNFIVGQELVIDKLLFEKKYLNNQRKNKLKNGCKLNYYLNEKFNIFLGYDNFMRIVFKKKKILRDDKLKKKEKEYNKHRKINDPCYKDDKDSKGKSNKINNLIEKDFLHNNNIIDNIIDNSNKQISNVNTQENIHLIEKDYDKIKKEKMNEKITENKEYNYSKDISNLKYEEKYNITNKIENPLTCEKSQILKENYNNKLEVNDNNYMNKLEGKDYIEYKLHNNNNVLKEITNERILFQSDNIQKSLNNNYVNNVDLKDDNNEISDDFQELLSLSSSSSYSDTSDISNISPDLLCFEKQFKYIYDMYKQNDKNVFLFYNPPVCKCINKILKEKYFRKLNIKYPCLFNCSFNNDNKDIIKIEGNNEDNNKNENKLLTYSEISSDAVEIKLYAKAFFEFYFFEKYFYYCMNNKNMLNSFENFNDNIIKVYKEEKQEREIDNEIEKKDEYEKNIHKIYENDEENLDPQTSKTNSNKTEIKSISNFPFNTEEMLNLYFDKCLYKIIKRKSKICDNNACCGLLYIPYSYIVVILNRKVENLTYACNNLNIPSNTDIYYNNKKNVITVCTKNSEHEFFCYYCLKQNSHVKNILIYDVYFEGFIPFFKPILNLKNKKNQEKIFNYINYNKNINLSIVFFLTNSTKSKKKNLSECTSYYKSKCNSNIINEKKKKKKTEEKKEKEKGNEKEKTEEKKGKEKENEKEKIEEKKKMKKKSDKEIMKEDSGEDYYDEETLKKKYDEIKSMKLRICKIYNINHRNEYKSVNSKKIYSNLNNENEDDDIENYFSNICNGNEVINNMNIKMVVDKIIKIINKKDNICNEKCIYYNYNNCTMKNKDVQIYLCESINSFGFDRRPLCVKKREVILSSYVHFHKIINNYYIYKNSKYLDNIIKNELNEDVFKKGIMKNQILTLDSSIEKLQDNWYENDLSSILFKDNNVISKNNENENFNITNHNICCDKKGINLKSFSEEEKNKNKNINTDHVFNDTFFIFNDNSDLYTNEEYKKNKLENLNKVNENNRNKNIPNPNNYIWDKICTNFMQSLFNIYVCSYLMKQNNYNLSEIEKKKKKIFKEFPYEKKLSIIKKYYYYLFDIYKNRFNINLNKKEEDTIHENNWINEDSYLLNNISKKRKNDENIINKNSCEKDECNKKITNNINNENNDSHKSKKMKKV
ncbi:conserved Plasmodium protein, unknown function [Plasmodium gallinaceum]|uniref:Uncharacterized protein n=1 Tax=Plasmodium gallinaceum TaxID=5849 RepID=A0A1J1GMK0_PLAGA|nr:conserved Plasmodium protein, unknown function [Plasmodium gallinaceum]CRG93588.1 conserved Plasmodium protein, unknown function [Plasmodium gallinaceum]